MRLIISINFYISYSFARSTTLISLNFLYASICLEEGLEWLLKFYMLSCISLHYTTKIAMEMGKKKVTKSLLTNVFLFHEFFFYIYAFPWSSILHYVLKSKRDQHSDPKKKVKERAEQWKKDEGRIQLSVVQTTWITHLSRRRCSSCIRFACSALIIQCLISSGKKTKWKTL